MLSVFTRLVIIAAAAGVCFTRKDNTATKRRGRESLVFLQVPKYIHYYVTHNRSANLTWEAANVCKIQIKCGGKKLLEEDTRVCGKSCQGCRTRKKTKIVTAADFPKDTRTITCRCKVWGRIAFRTEKIIIEKAYLDPNFGQIEPCYVASLNTTVVLPCRPPGGSPRPTVTWSKIGQSSSLFRYGRRVRLRGKKHLVIRRVQMGDSGEYQCVAQNMAARREGPVIRLVVRENVSAVNQSVPECGTEGNRTSDYESPTLMVGTRDALYTMDLLNTLNRRRIQAEKIVSLDFARDPNLIYWSNRKGINRFSMHNGIREDIPFRHDEVSSVEGLAVDWINEKLYWTDAKRDVIYVGDLQSGVKVKIIDKDLDSPRAIVVSHSESYIYWADRGSAPKIERARLDGTERKVFISNGIQFPNGLAIDESEKKLYWAGTDANNYGIIEFVSFDGLNRSVIFYRPGYHPFALDIYQHFVYWTDRKKNAVLRLNTSHRGGEEMIVVSGLNKPMGLKILHRRKEWRVPDTNPCEESNGQCDHMCLYLPFLARQRCLCEENFQLDGNGKTCRKRDFRGKTKVKSTPNSPTHPSLVIILSIVILLLVVIGFVFCVVRIVKKGCPCQRSQDLPRMTTQSTNPDDILEQGEELLDLTDHTELTRAGSQLHNEPSNLIGQDCSGHNEPSNLIGQDCSGDPSGSQTACEDSLVASRKGVVVYMTKVEVEQHGGVTIVGDDAKVHHHYSLQS